MLREKPQILVLTALAIVLFLVVIPGGLTIAILGVPHFGDSKILNDIGPLIYIATWMLMIGAELLVLMTFRKEE